MREVWDVIPLKGLGPLRFGMTQDQVAEFDQIMGPLEETNTETLPSGHHTVENEFRNINSPVCSFENGRLAIISASESDTIDVRFKDISVFKDDPKDVFSAFGQVAVDVFWYHHSVVMPSLAVEMMGFVMEYSPRGKPPIFKSKASGFTWPKLRLFAPDLSTFDEKLLLEISSKAE